MAVAVVVVPVTVRQAGATVDYGPRTKTTRSIWSKMEAGTFKFVELSKRIAENYREKEADNYASVGCISLK